MGFIPDTLQHIYLKEKFIFLFLHIIQLFISGEIWVKETEKVKGEKSGGVQPGKDALKQKC